MVKRFFIVHGWGNSPGDGWFPWLKRELESRGFEVFVPQLPDTEHPRIEKWVAKLSETVKIPDEQTYLIGHSMGCQTIARYLESLPEDIKIGGAIFVAGFFKRLTGIENEPGNDETVNHWLNAPLDLEKVKDYIVKSAAIFSDDDPYVPLDNQNDFRDKLGSQIIIEHQMGHFSGSIMQLPIVLELALKISS